MLIRLVIRLVVLALVTGAAAAIVPGIDVHGGFGTLLWLAVLFSVVNLVIGTLVRLITLPLILLTLGLFLLLINAGMLAITAGLSSHLDVDNFGAAFFGGLTISVFSWLAELILPLAERAKASR